MKPISKGHLKKLINLFIYLFIFWLRWISIAARAFSSCGEQGYSLLQCAGFSLWWLLLLQSTALGMRASVVVAHGLSICGLWDLECRLSSWGAWA